MPGTVAGGLRRHPTSYHWLWSGSLLRDLDSSDHRCLLDWPLLLPLPSLPPSSSCSLSWGATSCLHLTLEVALQAHPLNRPCGVELSENRRPQGSRPSKWRSWGPGQDLSRSSASPPLPSTPMIAAAPNGFFLMPLPAQTPHFPPPPLPARSATANLQWWLGVVTWGAIADPARDAKPSASLVDGKLFRWLFWPRNEGRSSWPWQRFVAGIGRIGGCVPADQPRGGVS